MFGIFPQFEDWYSSVTVYRIIVYLQGIRISTVRLNTSDTQYNIANTNATKTSYNSRHELYLTPDELP